MENNYQLSRIHNYVNGLMSKEDMYALEKEALQDPFLQDAIDGYKLQNGVDIMQLSLLQQRLAVRVAEKSINKSKRYYSWQRLTIGMVAAVMFVTVCSLILFKYLPQSKSTSNHEILISDAMYDYKIVTVNSESDVVPEGGWSEFYDVLNTKYSNNQNIVGEVEVKFSIDANRKVSNVQIIGLKEGDGGELLDLIKNKVKWQGNTASFILNIKKISI